MTITMETGILVVPAVGMTATTEILVSIQGRQRAKQLATARTGKTTIVMGILIAMILTALLALLVRVAQQRQR